MHRPLTTRHVTLTRRHHDRSGYILLIVIVMLVVAATALASLATQSLRLSIDAAAAQSSLQQRWGLRSCGQAVLPAAFDVFERQDEAVRDGQLPRPMVPAIRESVLLGGQRFDLILGDEDAKAGLNAMYHYGDRQQVEQAIRKLVSPGALRAMQLRPAMESSRFGRRGRPLVDTEARVDEDQSDEPSFTPLSAFQSWGDVFNLSRLRQTMGDDRVLAEVTGNMTCWSSGRLNCKRASDAAIKAVCQPIIPDALARKLLARYRETSGANIDRIIEEFVSSKRDQERLKGLLSDGSTVFSLWLEATSTHSRRQELMILKPDTEGLLRTIEFAMD